jgi:hypothetical protein
VSWFRRGQLSSRALSGTVERPTRLAALRGAITDAFLDGVTKVDDDVADRLRQHWDDGWNRGDVELIMAPFSDDVTFSSPFVSKLGGDPSVRTIEGRDALRTYVSDALRRTPGIRYSVDALHVGTNSIVLVYTCRFPDGRPDKRGADLMRVDDQGAVCEWQCHYEAEGPHSS